MFSSESNDDFDALIEQYSCQLLDFSGHYGSDDSFSYTAANCLGKPTKFPAYGDFAETFVLREIGDYHWTKTPSGEVFNRPYQSNEPSRFYHNFVDLKFAHAVYVSAIYIYETYHPGAVFSIWGGDDSGRWSLLWQKDSNKIGFPGHHPRAFSPPVQNTKFRVQTIRIIFCHSKIQGHSEIDAVALLGLTQSLQLRSEDSPEIPSTPIWNALQEERISAINVASLESLFNRNLCDVGQAILDTSTEATDNGCFDLLPKEVLLKIFGFLDLACLSSSARVCRLFHEVSRDPQLYTVLCLKSWFHLVSDGCLEYLAECCAYPSHLDLSWCGNYSKLSPPALSGFLDKCGHNLQSLRLSNCHSADAAVLRTISETCLQLQEINLANCHLLEPSDFDALRSLGTIQALNLGRTKVGNKQIQDILRSNKSLRYLNLSCCHYIQADEVCLLLSSLHPHLASLELWRSPTLTSAGVIAMSKLTELRQIDIGWCPMVNASHAECLLKIVNSCIKLECLVLTAQRQLSDRELRAMAANLSDLRQLDMMGTRHVTKTAVFNLLSACDKLELLNVGFCEQLEDAGLDDLRTSFQKCYIMNSFPC